MYGCMRGMNNETMDMNSILAIYRPPAVSLSISTMRERDWPVRYPPRPAQATTKNAAAAKPASATTARDSSRVLMAAPVDALADTEADDLEAEAEAEAEADAEAVAEAEAEARTEEPAELRDKSARILGEGKWRGVYASGNGLRKTGRTRRRRRLDTRWRTRFGRRRSPCRRSRRTYR